MRPKTVHIELAPYCLQDDDGKTNSALTLSVVDAVELELSDEQGNVKQFRSNPDRYAVDLVLERERLVLLRVDSKSIKRS